MARRKGKRSQPINSSGKSSGKKQTIGTIDMMELRRRIRKPTIRGHAHSTKKGKKGYNRREKHKKGHYNSRVDVPFYLDLKTVGFAAHTQAILSLRRQRKYSKKAPPSLCSPG